MSEFSPHSIDDVINMVVVMFVRQMAAKECRSNLSAMYQMKESAVISDGKKKTDARHATI